MESELDSENWPRFQQVNPAQSYPTEEEPHTEEPPHLQEDRSTYWAMQEGLLLTGPDKNSALYQGPRES